MQTRTVTYQADDVEMIGFFAIDDSRSGPRPAILLSPEAPGLDDFNRDRCRRFAQLGYAVLGLDFHGNGEILGREDMMARLTPFFQDPLRTRARAQAGLAALLAQPNVDATRVAAIGYCFGGTISLELARSGADIKAAVGFHSGLSTARPQDAKNIRAKVLILNGNADPSVPAEQRAAFEEEMTAGGVDWQLHLYGGIGHAFTNPNVDKFGMPGFAYNKAADERSWQAMLNLFEETLGPV
ncbi:MAG: dienelactone hydrolase [Verrucomicrobiaceae bacterium]|nr:dienelactone hydrolase [Verrucomicrobiaceae bacterium]